MALYLDDQTRGWLERAVKKANDKDFIAKRIDKMLQADRARLGSIAVCDHVLASYTGEKTCCAKCGSYLVGTGSSWTIKSDLSGSESTQS